MGDDTADSSCTDISMGTHPALKNKYNRKSRMSWNDSEEVDDVAALPLIRTGKQRAF